MPRAATDLLEPWPLFALSLEAVHRSPRTIQSYKEGVGQFADWLKARGRPTAIGELTRGDVDGFVADILTRHRPATAAARYRALHRYFGFLVEEEELAVSPMLKSHPPSVEQAPPPVLSEDELRRLLKACEGPKFEDRRDTAAIRVLIDTGCRLGELAALKVDDVDLEFKVLHVVGKGRRPRAAPYGPSTGLALGRYQRARRGHPRAAVSGLWIGQKGKLTPSGLAEMVRRRGNLAGLNGLHPHQFRHTAAHRWQLEGGNESDLMMLLGWRSRDMLNRYGRSAAAERAKESHRRLGLAERL